MAGETVPRSDGFGIWIRFWDLLVAFVLLAASFLLLRLEAVVQLRSLAVDKAYFVDKPLLLDTFRNGYTYETARDHLRALGDAGRDYYAQTFIPIYDLALSLFLLTFTILFILYATQSDKHYAIELPGWARRFLMLPPILQFAADVGENLAIRRLVDEFPRINAKLVETASTLTQFKWAAIFVNALIMTGLVVYTLTQWLTPPKP